MGEMFAVWEGDIVIEAQHSPVYKAIRQCTVQTALRLRLLPLSLSLSHSHTLSLLGTVGGSPAPIQSKSPSGQRRLLPTRRSKIAGCTSHSLQARVSCLSSPPQLVSLERSASVQVPPKTASSRLGHIVLISALSDSPPVLLPPPFLLHDAAQIVSHHLQPSRAPPPSSVPWSRQALPLSRDSYHIVPLSHLSTTTTLAHIPLAAALRL